MDFGNSACILEQEHDVNPSHYHEGWKGFRVDSDGFKYSVKNHHTDLLE